jgi:regulator of protease activity HflC (stomatin/prohibitin superfamily)
MKPNLRALLLGAVLAGGVAACTNPETPAGFEGYVFHVPLVIGKLDYRQTLTGPASTGVSWRLFVENLDMRAQSYIEDFTLLTRDNLNVTFQVSTRIALKPGSVREIVEGYGGVNWYAWNVKEPLRTTIRREVMEVSAIEIQLRTDEVRQRINDKLIARYEGTPIGILSVDIGSIEFPKEVTEAIQAKIAKQQELERQEYVLAKTRKEAAIRVLEALKVAKQQRIISETLDPLYVQRRAVQVYRQLAASKNRTIMVLPNTDDGSAMPLVHSSGKRKILTAEDERLLKRMEEQYMEVAALPTPDLADPPKVLPPAAAPEPAPVAPAPVAPAPATPPPPTP